MENMGWARIFDTWNWKALPLELDDDLVHYVGNLNSFSASFYCIYNFNTVLRHHIIFIFQYKTSHIEFSWVKCCKKVWKFEWRSVIILKPFTLKCMCTLQTWRLLTSRPTVTAFCFTRVVIGTASICPAHSHTSRVSIPTTIHTFVHPDQVMFTPIIQELLKKMAEPETWCIDSSLPGGGLLDRSQGRQVWHQQMEQCAAGLWSSLLKNRRE